MLALTVEVQDLEKRVSAMEGHLTRLLSIVVCIAEKIDADLPSDDGA